MPKYSITAPIATAISVMEGFTTAGTLARINHNPGNIRTWAGAGRDKLNHGYVVFVDDSAGWNALYKLVDDYVDGRYTGGRSPTLTEMFRTYAPAADANDPDHYARFVAARTGLSLTVSLATQAGAGGGGGGGGVAPTPGMPTDPAYLPLPTIDGTVDPSLTTEDSSTDIPVYVLGAVAVVILVLAFY